MIDLLRSLFAGDSREESVKKPAAKLTRACGADYRAVSLESGAACRAATGNAGKRYLLREVPRLPLPNCPAPHACTCRFRKHSDRRDGDRRLLGSIETSRWYVGAERRRLRHRRTDRQ